VTKKLFLSITLVAILIELIVVYNCYDTTFNNSPYIQIPSLASLFFVPLFCLLLISASEDSCFLQLVSLLSMVLFFYVIYLLSYNESEINKKQDKNQKLVIVPAILSNKPVRQFNNHGEDPTPDYLNFYFTNLPEYNYQLEYSYKNHNDQLWLKTNIGDTIYLEIPRREYEIKIAKTKEPSFREKHFYWNDIYIIGVSNRNFKVGCKYCYEGKYNNLE
jgi:hypothetical protein